MRSVLFAFACSLALAPASRADERRSYDVRDREFLQSTRCIPDRFLTEAVRLKEPAFCSQYSDSGKAGRALQEVLSVKYDAIKLAKNLGDLRPFVACGFYGNSLGDVGNRLTLVSKRLPKTPKKKHDGLQHCLTYWETQLECASIASGNSPRLTPKAMAFDASKIAKECPRLDPATASRIEFQTAPETSEEGDQTQSAAP